MPNLGSEMSCAFERAAPMLARPTTVSYKELLDQIPLQSQASTMLSGATCDRNFSKLRRWIR
jgi:hypothetical protein